MRNSSYLAHVCRWISVLVNAAFERAIECILKAHLVGARTESDVAERTTAQPRLSLWVKRRVDYGCEP